jgi:hypothetical protein
LDETDKYHCLGRCWKAQLSLVKLDEDLKIISTAGVHAPKNMPLLEYSFETGFADPRLFSWRGQLWGVSAVAHEDRGWVTQIALARFTQTDHELYILTDAKLVPSGISPRWEKNWMPQVVGDDLCLIYSVDPTRILTSSGIVLHEPHAPIAGETFRGGSQAIEFDDGWIMVILFTRSSM